VPMYHGPRDYDPSPATFFRNNGDGTFTDLSKESGIASVAGTGMGTICFDADADGHTDVFVCNDVRANFLFLNDGTGKFVESGLIRGVAYNYYGQANGSMGADCGDFDRDGWPDLFMTDYQNELPVLYKNLGNGFFEDSTLRTGAGAGSLPYVKWGTGFVDFDNDGDLDLFLACGHIQDNIERVDDSTGYEVYNVLLENVGGKFVDVSAQCGLRSLPKRSARGAAFDDLDNDGRVDVVVLNSRREPTILRNETANGNHFLDVRLEGVKSNRDGVGAQVTVIAGDLIQRAEVHSGRGYQGHFGTRLHFGLGKRQKVDRIEVRWLGGGLDVLLDVPSDRLLTIREGRSGSGVRP